MKKITIIAVILAMIFPVFGMNVHVHAYPGGLLDGKEMCLTTTITTYRCDETRTEATDGDTGTSVRFLYSNHRLFFEFDNFTSIQSFRVNHSSSNSIYAVIRYYDENGNIIYMHTMDEYGTREITHEVIHRVKRVSISPSRSNFYTSVYEFDVFPYIDTEPPGAPSNLEIEAVENVGAKLTWTGVDDDDLHGYYVYANEERLFNSPVTNTEYTVYSVEMTEGETYFFHVVAVDFAGNESARSNVVIYTQMDRTPPANVSGLAGKGENGEVSLTWTANTEPDLAGYYVYRDGVRITNEPISETSFDVTNLRDGMRYHFSVSAVDFAGNESARSNVYVYVYDTHAPETPRGLVASAANSSAGLYWTANTEPDLAGYYVYRDGVRITPQPISEIHTTIENLENDRTYSFSISAVDETGNESDRTAPVSVTPGVHENIDPPAAPTGLHGVGGDGAVSLTWDESPEANVIGYFVYMDSQRVNFAPITTNRIHIPNLFSGAYEYRVTAIDTNGRESARSSPITVNVVDETPPLPPFGLVGQPGNGNAKLTWTANTEPDLAGYIVYVNGEKAFDTVTGTVYTVRELVNGETYRFTVTAVDRDGNESEPSNIVLITPDERLVNWDELDSGQAIGSPVDAISSGFSFMQQYGGWVMLVLGLIISPIAISFLMWILRRGKKGKKVHVTLTKNGERRMKLEREKNKRKKATIVKPNRKRSTSTNRKRSTSTNRKRSSSTNRKRSSSTNRKRSSSTNRKRSTSTNRKRSTSTNTNRKGRKK